MAVRVADTLGTYGAGGYPIVNSPDVMTQDGDLQTVLDQIIANFVQSNWNQDNESKLDYIKNKPAIPVLTDLLNDTQDSTTTTYSSTKILALINSIEAGIKVEIVEELPTEDIDTHTLYLILRETTTENDSYDEYMYINSKWELIGNTQVDLSDYYKKSEVDALVKNKVDKVSGKDLSTNDFTDAYKTKLTKINENAEVNVQSDWNQNDTNADDYIKNKPYIPEGVTVDSELSSESTNPVQNKVINAKLQPATTAELGLVKVGDNLSVSADGTVSTSLNYSNATNKPQINSVTLDGNVSLKELGVDLDGYVVDRLYVHTDNNFTDVDKNKLEGIDAEIIDDTTASTSKVYSSSKVNELINAIEGGLKIEIVDALPTTGDTHTIYFKSRSQSETQNVYDEYMYVNNAWECIGSTAVDLSDYYTKSETDTDLAKKVSIVEGKDLSANDFTDDLKGKLQGIEATAQVNKLETIKLNGTAQTITDKSVDIITHDVASGGLQGQVLTKVSNSDYDVDWETFGKIQLDELPTASEDNYGTIVQYVGATTSELTNGHFYKSDIIETNTISSLGFRNTYSASSAVYYVDANCKAYDSIYDDKYLTTPHKGSTIVLKIGSINEDKTKLYTLDNKIYAWSRQYDYDYTETTTTYGWVDVGSIQTKEIPNANNYYVGKIFQYIGENTESYEKGKFYICKSKETQHTSYGYYYDYSKDLIFINSYPPVVGQELYTDNKSQILYGTQVIKTVYSNNKITYQSGGDYVRPDDGTYDNSWSTYEYYWETVNVSEDAITSIKVNGTEQEISDYSVNITVPQIDDTTASATTLYSSTKIDSLINALELGLTLIKVDVLPTENIDPKKIYLVPKTETGDDAYDEYVYIDNKWELIGSTAISLTWSNVEDKPFSTLDSETLSVTDGVLTVIGGGTGGGTIETIKVNSVEQPIVDKAVDITVPTKVSELTNDSEYVSKDSILDDSTKSAETTYSSNKIETMLGNEVEISNVAPTADSISLWIDTGMDATGKSTEVTVTPIVTSGIELATVSVDGNVKSIYSPTISATAIETNGTKIGNITVGDTSTDLYVSDSYSTTESVVGNWINGKAIYRKVVEFTASTGTSANTWINCFPLSGISSLISTHWYIGDAAEYIPLQTKYEDGSIYILTNSTNNVTFVRCVVEYTKA